MTSSLCVFHKDDLDGVCSAAIVKHFVPDCELFGMSYGQDFPWAMVDPREELPPDHLYRVWKDLDEKRAVYMVDFSLKPEDMKRLASVSDLVYIDHHKTALKAWFESDVRPAAQVVGDIRYAACELTWMYFQDGVEVNEYLNDEAHTLPSIPEAVRLLGAYDSWRKDDPDWATKILPFQYGCRAIEGVYDPADPVWPCLLSFAQPDKDGYVWLNFGAAEQAKLCPDALRRADIGFRIMEGQAILRYQAEVNRRACETGAHEICIHTWPTGCGYFAKPMSTRDGDEKFKEDNPQSTWYRALACNTIVFNSQFFDGFYDPEKHDVMCAYCQLANGSWKVSLYSTKPEIDCGAICKTFGGGGHAQAAGFVCDVLPWEAK